jgi:DnaJ-class molecular chaperone
VVRQAAIFFIEQILLSPGADSYRVLGAGPGASNAELRTNMALLMRWLHPDAAREGEQSVFAQRLAAAWNDLKSPERRAAYDSARRPPPGQAPGWGHGSRSGRSRRHSGSAGAPRRSRLPRLLAYFLLGRPRR